MAVHLVILLILTGLTGIHSITTVSKVSVKAGGSISIPCLYGSQYRNHVKYLCEGYYWNSCSYAVKTNQPDNSGKFSISDDKSRRIFTVTIKITYNDAYYWCAVEINGGGDVRQYFHLSVTRGTPSLYVERQEITGYNGEKITINCRNRNSGEMKWCRLGSSCVSGSSGSIDGTGVTIDRASSVFTVTMSGLKTESSGWYLCVKGDLQMPVHLSVTERPTTTTITTTTRLTTLSPTPTPEAVNINSVSADQTTTAVQSEQHSPSIQPKIFIIPLSLLIFIVMVTLFIWFMLKEHKQTKAAPSAMTEAEEEVTYSTVKKKRTSSQRYTDSDVDMIYSTVVTTRQQRVQKVDADDENVVYSMLA